jgi:putative component of membrane protein insertase Oxa1/YidC/SpoIIIJ protein YidD
MLLCTYLPVQAQIADEAAWVRKHQPAVHDRPSYRFDFEARNEADFLALFSFTFYKKYISSQDAISCTFEPSCSVFGLHAIRHHGLVVGSMATFDRLSRCHGWNRGDYGIHAPTNLNHDPVVYAPY